MSLYIDMPLEKLQAYVQINPFELELWLNLIQRVAETHGAENALEEVFVVEDIFPESPELQALKSLCLLSLGEVREAHDLLQQSLRRSPGDDLLDRILNEFLPAFETLNEDHLLNPFAIRDSARAEAAEDGFIERLDSTIDLIQTYNDVESDGEQLIAPLERHVQNFPSDINAKLDLARLCYNIGHHNRARQFYNEVIEADPFCGSAYFELATIEQEPAVAIELSEKGLDLCPMFECGRYNYATLLFKAGMLEEGRKEMLRIPADSSYYSLGLEAIANSHSQQGNFEKAIDFQRKVVALSNDNAEAWNCYGHFFAQMGDYENALLHFDRAIELDNEHLDGLYNRGLVLSRRERHEEAVMTLKYALAIEPTDVSVLANLVTELSHCKQFGEAIEFAEFATDHYPTNAQLWQLLGDAHRGNGNIEEAIRCEENAKRMG